MPRFSSFEEFLDFVPPGIAEQYKKAISLIRRLVPKAKEEIKYATPFFTWNGLFLYFAVQPRNRFVIGFCRGNQLSDEAAMLHADAGQKLIRHWVLSEDSAFDEDLFGAYLIEAADLQSQGLPWVVRKGSPRTS